MDRNWADYDWRVVGRIPDHCAGRQTGYGNKLCCGESTPAAKCEQYGRPERAREDRGVFRFSMPILRAVLYKYGTVIG